MNWQLSKTKWLKPSKIYQKYKEQLLIVKNSGLDRKTHFQKSLNLLSQEAEQNEKLNAWNSIIWMTFYS